MIQIMKAIYTVLLFLLSVLSSEPIVLQGYIGKEQIESQEKVLSSSNEGPLILMINSDSGDLQQVLQFAKRIYEKKRALNSKLIVYIDDNAVGPAAVLPFLADELYTSVFVTWGDVLTSSDRPLPKNVLKSQVMGLIGNENPNLTLLAEAMVDKDLVVVDDGGWKIYSGFEPPAGKIVNPYGEALVMSHRSMKKLDLITKEMSLKEFKGMFGITVEIEPSISAIVSGPSGSLDAKLKEHIRYNPEGKNLVGRIVIDDRTSGINEGTWLYVKSALDSYKEKKPIFIILELNTPGGQVFSSQKISDALKAIDTQFGIPVVTYINNWAISAGAMLAYSTRFITIAKDASMGAAEPVFQTQEGMKTASEKINSALRADFANRAAFFGRSPAIAEAMVDKEILLVLRGKKFIALASEQELRTTDIVISPKGKLLTLNANELMEYGVADLLVTPQKIPDVSQAEKQEGSWSGGKEELFQQPFFREIPNVTIDTFKPDWKLSFFAFLAHPMIASILFMGMLVGFYIEINTPGFGVPGSIGVACLLMMILSSFALEAINSLEIIILITGMVLLALELFVIPGFGIVGTLGAILFIGGLFMVLLPGLENFSYEYDTGTLNAAGEYVVKRLAWLSGGFLVGIGVIAFLARYVFPKFSPFQRFVLSGGEQEGYISSEKISISVGTVGEVITPLRPFGKVEIEGVLYEATTESDWVDAGSKVVVIGEEGYTLKVEKQ